MTKTVGILIGLLLLYSCYSVKQLEKQLPETSRDFPEHTTMTFDGKDTACNRIVYGDLAFQHNNRLIQGYDTVGPAKLHFYYDGQETLIVTPSDYPTRKVKDLVFKVRRNDHHLILRPKFNLIPFIPFIFLLQRQLMVVEIDDEENLVIMSRNYIEFYIFLYFTAENISNVDMGQYVLRQAESVPLDEIQNSAE